MAELISKDKQYRTRDGREVRIYATDGGGRYPVQGAFFNEEGLWVIRAWTKHGNVHGGFLCDNPYDLIEVRPRIKRTVWLNVYEDGETVIG